MKATVARENRYNITIGDKVLTGFRKESEWEGMIKFRSHKGVVIVDNGRSDFESIFDSLVGKSEKDATELSIIKLSSDLIPLDNDKQ